MKEKKLRKQITIFSGAVIKDGKVLMNLRTEEECPDAHMKWEFPGGKVEFGESPEEAIVREFKEETGREIKVLSLLPKIWVNYWDYPWGEQQTLCFVFICELVKDGELQQKDHQVERSEWVAFEEIDFENSLPGTMEILEIAKDTLGVI